MSRVLPPGPRRWRGVALVLPFVVMIAVIFGYTNYVQRESDQRWCDLMVLLDNQYQVTPPETESGQQFAEIIHRLRGEFHCD